MQIEARILGELATSHILPGAIRYQNVLLENIRGLKEVGLDSETYSNQKQILVKISEHISKVSSLVEKMIETRKKVNNLTDNRQKAIAYDEEIKQKFFDQIRYSVDKLELLVADQYWQLPKYREMLFLR